MDEDLREQILALLDRHRIVSIATLRRDGWPQATTVSYASEGLPQQTSVPLPMPTPADVGIFRVTPTMISALDYSKGFAHMDLVTG